MADSTILDSDDRTVCSNQLARFLFFFTKKGPTDRGALARPMIHEAVGEPFGVLTRVISKTASLLRRRLFICSYMFFKRLYRVVAP